MKNQALKRWQQTRFPRSGKAIKVAYTVAGKVAKQKVKSCSK